MNSLAELRRWEDDPDSEVDLLIFPQRDRYVASVHETGLASQCVKSPRHLSHTTHTMSAVEITLTTRVASCSTTPVSRRKELRKFWSFVNLGRG